MELERRLDCSGRAIDIGDAIGNFRGFTRPLAGRGNTTMLDLSVCETCHDHHSFGALRTVE